MAHMDVVEARREDWTHAVPIPREDGYYLGRGAADNKAGMAAIVAALQRLKATGFQPKRDIIVLFTGDEETSGNGARRAATEWRSLIDAEYALECRRRRRLDLSRRAGRGFGFQTAEKIYADYRFTATNRGGHSAAPRAGQCDLCAGAALDTLKATASGR